MRPELSRAIWFPTLLIAIMGSRPMTMWLSGFVDASGNLSDGSPVDRNFFLILIISGFFILHRRNFRWGPFVSSNKAIFAFYAYLLITILWADSSLSAFKRLFKDFGAVVLSLVILTEAQPLEAVKAVFVRCAYLFFPLSICFIRYFPNLGRVYSRGGGLEVTGVTCQKNSLGALVVICGLPLFWELLQRYKDGTYRKVKREYFGAVFVGLIGLWLLNLSNSKTSLICFVMGIVILLFPFVSVLKRKTRKLAIYMPLVAFLAIGLDAAIGIKEAALNELGRDSTFTGRTQVWEFLLKEHTDPIFGTGYYSLWSTPSFRNHMPDWMSNSAHNGYLEAYIEGGYIEIFFLIIMIVTVWWKLNRKLKRGEQGAVIGLAFFMTCVVGNFSESYFARLGLVWFCFLLFGVDNIPRLRFRKHRARLAEHDAVLPDREPALS